MQVKLTEPAIRAAAARVASSGKREDISDATLPGLRIRLTPAGGKSWVLACRDSLGDMRRFPLGDFPVMGIGEAREAARALRAEVRKGADPVADAKRQRALGAAAREGVGTLTAVLDIYAKQHGESLKSWAECRQRIDSVFAPFLTKATQTLKMADLQLQADQWPSPQSAAAAVRYLRPVMKWAAHRKYVPSELSQIVPPVPIVQRKRVLSRDELGKLLPVLRSSTRPYANALRFMLLTLTRREETAAARWGDINFATGVWTIEDTKNGQTHMVPLPRQAIELLKARQPVDASADSLIFATSTGASLGNWDRETKAFQTTSQTSDWTRHDLRRTGATMLGEMGELPDIIEAALNHVSIRSALAATYNRSRYRPQVAAALQRLADELDAIEKTAKEKAA